jgi:hypothetical protein
LTGDITSEKAIALRMFFERLPARTDLPGVNVVLKSNGGDVSAAMDIGRFLRSNSAWVTVPFGAPCASACVLVLAGAVQRSIFGPIIIHRLYRADAEPLGLARAQSEFEQRGKVIKAYLDEMNIPTSLYEAMLAIPSESERELSEAELENFRLNMADVVYEEENAAGTAKYLGISMSEYLGRLAARDDCIDSVQEDFATHDEWEAAQARCYALVDSP